MGIANHVAPHVALAAVIVPLKPHLSFTADSLPPEYCWHRCQYHHQENNPNRPCVIYRANSTSSHFWRVGPFSRGSIARSFMVEAKQTGGAPLLAGFEKW